MKGADMKPMVDHSQSFKTDPVRSIARAAVARAKHQIDRSIKVEEYAAKTWPLDSYVPLILRAAVTPYDMTNAAALVQISAAVLEVLAPASAAAELFKRCPSVTLGPASGGVTVPHCNAVPVAFVADGAAKPVVQGLTGGVRIDPHKVAGIIPVSSELFEVPNIEAFMQSVLTYSAGPVLDSVVFSNAAATAPAPAGLLNGISALTPTAPGTGSNVNDVMLGDITKLAGALATISGAGDVAVIMHPTQAAGLAFRTARDAGHIVPLVSGAIPAGTIIAVAVNAVAAAIDPPEFETSTQATLSMNDAATAWPGGPVSSMFQTASIAIKMVLNVSWARRSNVGVAWMQSVNW
jgi:hypothetical protein